jgi:low affinity Fe/Cu permease
MRQCEGQETETKPPIPVRRRDLFSTVSGWTIRITGGRWGFMTALGAVLIWAVSGPFFHFSENWQLVINTGTTIVTFLMVFLIQNAQNRESKALHLKLDELIMGVNHARNELIDIERLSDEQLDALAARYHREAERHLHKLTECFPPEVCAEPTSGASNGKLT